MIIPGVLLKHYPAVKYKEMFPVGSGVILVIKINKFWFGSESGKTYNLKLYKKVGTMKPAGEQYRPKCNQIIQKSSRVVK